MKNNNSVTVLIIIVLFVFSVACKNKQEKINNVNRTIENKIDEYLKPFIKTDLFNGTILFAKNDKIIVNKAYGFANYEHKVVNNLATKFRIASLSKLFTKLAIYQLEEKGFLHLDDKLTQFITDYPQGNTISIQHLLDHSAGIPHINDFTDYDKFAKEQYSVNKIINLFKNKPLEYESGAKKTYSNSGYVLLVYIIEKVSGLNYEDYLDKNIFQPSGMLNSGHDSGNEIIQNLAKGYMMNLRGKGLQLPIYYNPSIKIGGGSLYSTAKDLFLFSNAYKNGRLSKTAKALYNEGIFGKSPGFNAMIWEKDDLKIIILSNNYNTPIKKMFFDLTNMLNEKEYDILKIKEDKTIKKEDLIPYQGNYKIDDDIETIKLINNTLIEYENGDELRACRLIPISKDVFYDTCYMEKLVFTRDENGIINGFKWESGDKTTLINSK